MEGLKLLAVLCALLSSCVSHRRHDHSAGFSDGVTSSSGGRSEENWDDWSGENDVMSEDLNLQSKMLEKLLDFAEKLSTGNDSSEDVADSSEEPSRRLDDISYSKRRFDRKHVRKMMHHYSGLWDVSNLAVQCMSINDQVEMLCSKISPLESVLPAKRTRKRGSLSTCCKHQKVEKRVQCIEKKRNIKYEKACKKEWSSRASMNQCCQLSGNARMECFEEPKRLLCDKVNPDGTPKDALSWSDIIPSSPLFSGHHHGGGRNKGGRQGGHHEWKRCCDAGRNFTSYNSTPSLSECAYDFIEWLNFTQVPSFTCAKGFMKCCANMTKPRNSSVEVERAYIHHNITELRNKTRGHSWNHFRHGGRGHHKHGERHHDYRGRNTSGRESQGRIVEVGYGIPHQYMQTLDTARQYMKCCGMGSEVGKVNSEVKYCEYSYTEWERTQKADLPEKCLDKFVSCCVSQHPEHHESRVGWTDVQLAPIRNLEITSDGLILPDETGQQIEEFMPLPQEPTVTWVEEEDSTDGLILPDETGQQVEVYMSAPEEPSVTWVEDRDTTSLRVHVVSAEKPAVIPTLDCCNQGKLQSRDIIGSANDRRCDFQLSLFSRENDVDQECASQFMTCCNPNGVESDEKMRIQEGGRPLPPGMRVDSKGRRFYIDRRLPPKVVRRNRHGKKV